ncbi:16S rRNA (adenine(1518)-N(6)/adenine(1519)-N(6))-dimethyltransferase RsmA [Geopsychrobacter electrodiphilus]|uniref:16S rRNA (adenine(1518)-N(6)/adenine(1519)-N(6))- dimethyltransferase RsmA n=1 Tax=Geopsychrobacter electrodiphilus TaxID=225196 RepID=UPI000371A718|nr:16S rRNA (adenine(1518)-N(6)/adenine(1519)-N(6))-dimethyltransferase RsmA [Geopsychrobacter electrodiphilus]
MEYRTKKRFGQHFLNDQSVIDQILQAANICKTDRCVEIGPGLGVLTEYLLDAAAQVDVFEIDRDLIARLQQRQDPRLIVHAGDILKANLATLLTAPPYTLVANLPYNISSQVVFLLIENRHLFSRMVLMFQKEVGDRLCAQPGCKDYGILSVLCQLWFDVEPVVEVSPESFSPPPKVDSLVLLFSPLGAPRVDPIEFGFFTKVVKAAFTQRRKQLRNSMMAGNFTREEVDAGLSAAEILPSRRGESLDLSDFSRLTRALYALRFP